MVKTFFKAKYVYPVSRPVIENGGILVEDGKIVRVDEAEEFFDVDLDQYEQVDLSDSIILPGLINAHTHLEFSLLGKLSTKSFSDFLWQTIEATNSWNETKIRDSIKLGIKQSLEAGVTTIADISRWGLSPLVLSEYPIIADVAIETFSYDAKSSEEVFSKLKDKLKYIESKISPRIRLSLSPHSPYNSDPRLWEMIIEYTLKNNMFVHTHLSESLEEKKWFEFGSSEIDEFHNLIGWPKVSPQITSMSPVEYLSTMQLLSPNLLAAHLCYASSRDLELLEDKNVTVIICPRSNMHLHHRMLEYNLLNSLKVKAAIGTDGVSSSGNLNLLEDIRLYNSKNHIRFEELTKMVTLYPAKYLKFDNLIGSIDAGKLANFTVFGPIDTPSNWFNFNKASNVFIEGVSVFNKV